MLDDLTVIATILRSLGDNVLKHYTSCLDSLGVRKPEYEIVCAISALSKSPGIARGVLEYIESAIPKNKYTVRVVLELKVKANSVSDVEEHVKKVFTSIKDELIEQIMLSEIKVKTNNLGDIIVYKRP